MGGRGGAYPTLDINILTIFDQSNSENSIFGKPRHKSLKKFLLVAVAVPLGRHASLRVDLARSGQFSDFVMHTSSLFQLMKPSYRPAATDSPLHSYLSVLFFSLIQSFAR